MANHGQAMGKQQLLDRILRGNVTPDFDPNAKAIATMQKKINDLLKKEMI